MSATLNVGSFRSDDTLYAASRTLKSYLRSILMRKWDPTDPKVRFGSTADGRPPLGYVRFTPQSGHGVGCLEMSALCHKPTYARSKFFLFDHAVSECEQLVGNIEAGFLKLARMDDVRGSRVLDHAAAGHSAPTSS